MEYLSLASPTCTEPSHLIVESLNIGLHVFILFTFLLAFYILVISKLAKDKMEEEIGHAIHDGINTKLKSLPPDQQHVIKQGLQRVNWNTFEKLFDRPDKATQIHNEWLLRTGKITSFVIFGAVLLSVYILAKSSDKCIPVKELLLMNGAIFGCVGVVEYIFFKQIAFKFVPSLPSLMINEFITAIKKKIGGGNAEESVIDTVQQKYDKTKDQIKHQILTTIGNVAEAENEYHKLSNQVTRVKTTGEI